MLAAALITGGLLGAAPAQASTVHLSLLQRGASVSGSGDTRGGTVPPFSPGIHEIAPDIDSLTGEGHEGTGDDAAITALADEGDGSIPSPSPLDVTLASGVPGFSGINHRDQRLADNGNQFSLEPPDQALCVGNGFVVESVNLAVAVYHQDGSLVGLASLNRFLGLDSAATRDPVTGAIVRFGPFTSDPKCIYDSDTGRFYLTALEIDTDPDTGDFQGASHVYIAVSQTGDPGGGWTIFNFATTNAGGDPTTPNHIGCPCLGDQPLIGADANALVITTNEFPIFENGFNGAQLYAMSKTLLAQAANDPSVSVTVAGIENVPRRGLKATSLDPAITAPGAANAPDTEFLLSSRTSSHTVDHRIVVWALTGTSTLVNPTPSLDLTFHALPSVAYGNPPLVPQKDGPRPLADAIASGAVFGVPLHRPKLGKINANDDRINGTVMYQGGMLWGSLNTVLANESGKVNRSGIAYFVIQPGSVKGKLTGSMVNQGYVSVRRGSVMYGSWGVNAAGRGVLAMSIFRSKLGLYPSTAYVTMTATGAPSAVQVTGVGVAPQDGFSEYPQYFGGRPRWGDYSAAAVDADGSVWVANEYIPGPRTLLANWGTFITHVAP